MVQKKNALLFAAFMIAITAFAVYIVNASCPQTSCQEYTDEGKLYSFKLTDFRKELSFYEYGCSPIYGSTEVKGTTGFAKCCYANFEFCENGCNEGQCLSAPRTLPEIKLEIEKGTVSEKSKQITLLEGANLIGGFAFNKDLLEKAGCQLTFFNGQSDVDNPFVYWDSAAKKFQKLSSVESIKSVHGYWVALSKGCTLSLSFDSRTSISIADTQIQLISAPFSVTKEELVAAGCKFSFFNQVSDLDKPFVYYDTKTNKFVKTNKMDADGKGYWVPVDKGCSKAAAQLTQASKEEGGMKLPQMAA